MTLSEKIAERLLWLRNEKKFTQEEVAAASNIALITYIKYESGKASPVFKNLYALAEFYQVSLDYLSCRTNDRHIHYL